LDTHQLRLDVKRKGRSTKFYPRFIGPFPIVQARPSSSNYKLQLPPEYKIHNVFHVSRLRPHVPNDPILFPNREPPRPPPVIEGSDEYEIKRIIDHRDTRQGRQYKVHWLGYPNSDDSWVHEGELEAEELLAEYWDHVNQEDE
jgi:hypothetical protein